MSILKRTSVFPLIWSVLFLIRSWIGKSKTVSSISFCLSRSHRMHLKGREVQGEEDLYEMSKFSHRDKFLTLFLMEITQRKDGKTLISSLHFITNQLIFTRLQKNIFISPPPRNIFKMRSEKWKKKFEMKLFAFKFRFPRKFIILPLKKLPYSIPLSFCFFQVCLNHTSALVWEMTEGWKQQGQRKERPKLYLMIR